MEGGLIMTIEEKESRLEEIVNCLKKRNILRVREILLSNLLDYPNDKDFLIECYHLALGDSLVFQKHNQEMLDYKLQHWDEEMYPTLLKDLKKNYSRRRYHLAMDLAIYFDELKQPEELVENEEELEIEIKPVKKPVNTTLFLFDSTFNILPSTNNFQKSTEVIKNEIGKI